MSYGPGVIYINIYYHTCCSVRLLINSTVDVRVFPIPFRHWGGGGFVPPYGGAQVLGDKALMGGLMRRDIDLTGGGLTLIDYIIN